MQTPTRILALAAAAAGLVFGVPQVPVAAASVPTHHVWFHAMAVPNDPLYPLQWNMQPNTVVPGGADWLPAHDAGVTGKGVVVAIVDTGVSTNNQLANVLPGWNFITNTADTSDDAGHGTHVAGTIAQKVDDGAGPIGIAPDAQILPVKVLDGMGAGSDTTIVAGINYAVRHGAKVINLSLGGDGDGGVCAAVANAVSAGVVVVAAAGNSSGPVSYPAACPGAIAVSASKLQGNFADYSNFGPQVAIAAPGGDTLDDVNQDGKPDGILQYTVMDGKWGYYFLAGTSMATPHVAGAAALVLQARPTATPADVRSILTSTALPKGSPTQFGAGILDIGAAVAAALNGQSVPSTPPTTTPTLPNDPSASPDGGVTRLEGASRFGTAAAVSAKGWPDGSQRVFLTSGRSFPDALATGALAGRFPGPLLLTEPCSLPPETAAELVRLRPGIVSVVGGPAAVCDAVVDQVTAITNGATVDRVAGEDRYGTSVVLSAAGWPQGSGTVYVASGANFADALGGGAQAARAGAPLLLTAPCSLPDRVAAEIVRLHPTSIVVLGGPSAVCGAVSDQLAQLSGATVTRVQGVDRYATAAAGVAAGWPDTAFTVFLASGDGFADGLAVGPLAARGQAPLLVVPSCSMPSGVSDLVARLHPTDLVVVGGAAAVCDTIINDLAASVAAAK